MAGLSSAKARKILSEGVARGRTLSKAQRGFFGARAAGLPIKNIMKRRAR